MFRSPDYSKARGKKEGFRHSLAGDLKAENWLRERMIEPASNSEHCWRMVIEQLCKDLQGK